MSVEWDLVSPVEAAGEAERTHLALCFCRGHFPGGAAAVLLDADVAVEGSQWAGGVPQSCVPVWDDEIIFHSVEAYCAMLMDKFNLPSTSCEFMAVSICT